MAVYTEVSFEELENFLKSYDVGTPRVFKGIAEGVSNSNYFLQTEKATFILTLYEKRIKTDELPFFLDLMEHLAALGIPCPTPVHAKNGSTTASLKDHSAAILTFLDGVSLCRPSTEHCLLAGSALANLHVKGKKISQHRENALGLSSWKAIAAEIMAEGNDVVDGVTKLVEAELDFLSMNWPSSLPSGIIHADFFPDNVLFVKNKISGIIDFYFACTDAFSYDLAVALNAWCFEADGSYNVTKGQALISGYDSVRVLEQSEREALPILCRGAALRFLLTRLYDWLNDSPDAFVKPKNPNEFVRRLRFHQSAAGPEAYGI